MIAAKIVPLFVLLMGMVALALGLARFVFQVPFRGNLVLLRTACACGVLTGIGTFLSTLARSANQTQLTSFFVNPPLAMLSGALTPIQAMPKWMQPWTLLNPIAHFAAISRNVLGKGGSTQRDATNPIDGPALLRRRTVRRGKDAEGEGKDQGTDSPHPHSITWSARSGSDFGMASPSAFAVFWLIDDEILSLDVPVLAQSLAKGAEEVPAGGRRFGTEEPDAGMLDRLQRPGAERHREKRSRTGDEGATVQHS